MLQIRFVTKGVALGAGAFGEKIADEYRRQLGDRRRRASVEAWALDETCALRRDKKAIG
jgi:hypothetical protein